MRRKLRRERRQGATIPLHRRADSVIDDKRRDVGFISRKGAGGDNGGDSEQGKQSFFHPGFLNKQVPKE
ncbi:hypothetical protein NUBL21995_11550 [Klebsiella pneumoniae]|nr:hypothetical protein NUBL21995_11550 [Klebsiella pneumoniae]